MNRSGQNRLAFFLLASISWISLGDLASAQIEPKNEPKTQEVVEKVDFVKDTLRLLKVGVRDEKIVAHWDKKKSWPDSITDMNYLALRDAGGGRFLMKRLKTMLKGKTGRSFMAEKYQDFEGLTSFGHSFAILRPRNWIVEAKEKQPGYYSFHEHKLKAWFRRTSYFLWFFDGKEWKTKNEAVLAKVTLQACAKRFKKGGFEVSPISEEKIIYKRDKSEYHCVYAICRDPRTQLKGLIALTLRVDEKNGLVPVLGFTTGIGQDQNRGRVLKSQLAEMFGTLKIQRQLSSGTKKK